MSAVEIVITGIGVISPIGIGCQPFWKSLLEGRSGVGRPELSDLDGLPCRLGAEIKDFDAKQYVRPRKSLKVMSRDAQLAVAAANLACQHAGLAPGSVDPQRFGVVLAADQIVSPLEEATIPYRECIHEGRFDYDRWGTDGMAVSYPLAFLRVLPNMLASHISIAQDARGPNNTILQDDVSSLNAIGEAARVIQRGAADVMLAGGASSQMQPVDWIRRCLLRPLSRRHDDPAAAMRPFDADRDGTVWGEGVAIFVLESRPHAEARGAALLARLLGWGCGFDPARNRKPHSRTALVRTMTGALLQAGLDPQQLGHLNAQGLSTREHDRLEARAIGAVAAEVPVTAPRSLFGTLGAAAGAVELVASLLAFQHDVVPATLNYRRPDPQCPLCVVHGQPLACRPPTALSVNWTDLGQVSAVVVAGPE